MTENKKTLIISIVAVVLFIAAIASASFAFYVATTKSDSDPNIGSENITAEVSTTLKDDNAIEVTMIPGDTFEKTFSITNNGPDLSFYIAVLELENNFKTPSDITYVLTVDGDEIGNGTFPQPPQGSSENYSANLSNSSVTVKNGETKTYKLTITYTNVKDRDQSPDMGSKISGKIFIRGV